MELHRHELRSPDEMVDLARHPVTDFSSPHGQVALQALRRARVEEGVAILPGFLRPEAVEAIAREAEALTGRAHREDVRGTSYLELPDPSYPEGHPRRASLRSATWVIPYDLFPESSPLRALYEWVLKSITCTPIERFWG